MTGILGGLIGSTAGKKGLIGFSTQILTPASTESISLSVPSNTVPGDLLVVFVMPSSTSSNRWSTAAGWTERTDLRGRLLSTRIWDGVSSIYSFSNTRSTSKTGVMLSFRSFNYGAASDPSDYAQDPAADSINVPVNGSILLASGTSLGAETDFSAPSGWTKIVNLTTPTSLCLFIKDTPQPAGASGPTTLTRISGTSRTSRAQHVSLSPV